MCIAICKPKSRTIAPETLERCFNNNPDGAGFTIAHDGRLHTYKGFDKFSTFIWAYRFHEVDISDSLIHFRITTRGADGPENCHPFQMKHAALIHNGTIFGMGEARGQGKSDTRVLSEMLHDFTFEQLKRTAPGLENGIGHSLIALMNAKGEFLRLNEHSWIEDDGVFYSNNSYQPYTPSFHYGLGRNEFKVSAQPIVGHAWENNALFVTYDGENYTHDPDLENAVLDAWFEETGFIGFSKTELPELNHITKEIINLENAPCSLNSLTAQNQQPLSSF